MDEHRASERTRFGRRQQALELPLARAPREAALSLLALGAWFVASTVSHVQDRVDVWLDPFNPQWVEKEGYQLAQSVFAQADGQLLVLSQESAKLVNATRTGTVTSSLTLGTAAEGHEGVTMDAAGRVYVVNELGGGDRPQLWVYAPSGAGGPNQAPTAVTLTNPIASVSSTAAPGSSRCSPCPGTPVGPGSIAPSTRSPASTSATRRSSS